MAQSVKRLLGKLEDLRTLVWVPRTNVKMTVMETHACSLALGREDRRSFGSW